MRLKGPINGSAHKRHMHLCPLFHCLSLCKFSDLTKGVHLIADSAPADIIKHLFVDINEAFNECEFWTNSYDNKGRIGMLLCHYCASCSDTLITSTICSLSNTCFDLWLSAMNFYSLHLTVFWMCLELLSMCTCTYINVWKFSDYLKLSNM